MRLDFELLKDINDQLGSFQIGAQSQNVYTFRFGYWRKINVTLLQHLLPVYLSVEENLVDEDEDCGELFNYIITRNKII